MFARIAERKMRIVRGLLLAAWLVLIASLFYDPISAHWTDPNNLASPFRILQSTYQLRNETIPVDPYPMGNRIFWTMIVPILPMFLLVFGHEAWRRICPLSFASQLPRYLGLQRQRLVLQRRTGATETMRYLVGRGSWLKRNAWYVQFGLLFLGLSARLLILNSDRHALAIALLGVIAAAILTGYLWDGKTWCNYFCPANVVQRIYTEPRGLLESTPHMQRSATPQSMCRTSGGADGRDQSACVACTVNCGDIDLERSYWDTIGDVKRRNVYYMFPGLVLGFYAYYLVYAGNWDYYFSGIWTHEAGAPGRLMSVGMWLGGTAVSIPKLFAAPLFLAVCVALTLGIGRILENFYRAIRLRRGRISEGEIQNHCLSFTSYVSFNCFYLFGGRPNLLLLPSYLVHAVDILIIILSTMWLLQALSRTQLKYRRESMAMGLLGQLRNLKVEIGQYFEGRSLEELRPDEIYVVSRVLPAFSHEHKLTAYRNLLDDAISTGKVASGSFLEVLAEMRGQLDITPEEHTRIHDQLGTASDINFDAQAAIAQEKAQCLQKYTQMVGASIILHLLRGRGLEEVVGSAELEPVIRVLRASLQITDGEHEAALMHLVSENGPVAEAVENRLKHLQNLRVGRFCLEANLFEDGFWSELGELLVGQIDARIAAALREMVGLLAALYEEAQAQFYSASMAALDRAACAALLGEPVHRHGLVTWQETLPPAIVDTLAAKITETETSGAFSGRPSYRYRDVIAAGHDVERSLRGLAGGNDPVLTALALTVFAYLKEGAAKDFAVELLTEDGGSDHWMLLEVAETLAGSRKASEEAPDGDYQITVRDAHGEREVAFTGAALTIGSAFGNGIMLSGPGVAPYHLTLYSGMGGIRLVRLDDAPVLVNGVPMVNSSIEFEGAVRLTFGAVDDQGAVVLLRPIRGSAAYSLQPSDAVMRLVWLGHAKMFREADLAALARLARISEVRRYPGQAAVFEPGDLADEALVLRVGGVHETDAAASDAEALPDQRREWPRLPGVMRVSKVKVATEFAVVLAVRGDAADERAALGRTERAVEKKPSHPPEKAMEVAR